MWKCKNCGKEVKKYHTFCSIECKREWGKAQATRCYNGIKARGRNTCAGCDLDPYCKIGEDNAAWLFGEFLPAIDPTGQTFGMPQKEQTQ